MDAGVDENTLGHIFNMEDSASRMFGTGAYKKQCVITSQYLVWIGTGLSNITFAGVAVGTVDAAYQLINSIANRGLTETTIAIVKGIQRLPENIVEGLNSTDPKVRGETLVNALLITGVATTVGPKIGVKILENAGTGPSAGSRAAQRGGIPIGKTPNKKPADAGGSPAGATLAETQAMLVNQVADLRAALTGSAKTSGNLGVAQIDIPGIQPMMAASSRIESPTSSQRNLGFVGEVPETFPSSVVPIGSVPPVFINRSIDSEAKILNNIAMKLGDNSSATGTINLLTERAPCASCSNVIESFKIKYPNIKINVMDNGGVIRPTKRGP